MNTGKEHTSRSHIDPLIAFVVVFAVVLLAIFICVRMLEKMSLMEAYENDAEALEQLAQELFPQREEGKVICIVKGDDYSKFGKETAVHLEDFFSQVACDYLFVATTGDGSNYCQFARETKSSDVGIIYIQGGHIAGNGTTDGYSNVFPATPIREWKRLTSEWLYYDALSYEEEMKLPF